MADDIDDLDRFSKFATTVSITTERGWLAEAHRCGLKAGLAGADPAIELARVVHQAAIRDPATEEIANSPDHPAAFAARLAMGRVDPATIAETFMEGWREGEADRRGPAGCRRGRRRRCPARTRRP